MNRDNVYIFDKITFVRQLLGEIQTDFNMGLAIDGAKDSVTIIVDSYVDFEIEPYTILWHEKTNTWWTISHDKVERFENEIGYYYRHNLDLVGAIELTNARDYTDSGYNDNTYTIREFIIRAFSLSTFEYNFAIRTELNLDKKVEFIKSFENYTLYSVLREFLDAFNCCAKLTFTQYTIHGTTRISGAVLDILLKTGNASYQAHDIDFFDYSKEIKTIDKNSFGTCVISNADNVISSQAKTYPACGLIGFSSNAYDITFSNAILRLPTPVYKVNWLKLVYPSVFIKFMFNGNTGTEEATLELPYDSDDYSVNYIRNYISNIPCPDKITIENRDYALSKVNEIWKNAKLLSTTTLYDGVEYKPDKTFVKPSNVPYIPKFSPSGLGNDLPVIICDKSVKQNLERPSQGIAWERGSDIITGFEILSTNPNVSTIYTDGYRVYDNGTYNDEPLLVVFADSNNARVTGSIGNVFSLTGYGKKPMFIINYIPMSNLKIKVDNNRDKKDIQLYNQNGKLTDSYALSKLLNSYAKEISSNNLVRYKSFTNFNDIPKVGSFVNNGNETYVINNVSMTFYQNESNVDNDFCYFIECEFNMCKYVSTKSLMVNPNTNIRDYGIPQNYNVKRKQLYRDYYELSYDLFSDANRKIPYFALNNVLSFDNNYKKTSDYATFLKIDYDNEVEGSYSWYYQLDGSTIMLQKQMIIVFDFKDNNIIGYCQNNREFIFDVSNLFNQHSLINTPISYVDDKGRLKNITLMIIDQNTRGTLDYTYYAIYNLRPDYDALATQVYIPQELYDLALSNNMYSVIIENENYNKDALEVPVFEYACQVDDSENVLIGDNVLQQYEDNIYFYNACVGENLNQNNSDDTEPLEHEIVEIEPNVFVEYLVQNRAVVINYNIANNEIQITFYANCRYDTGTGERTLVNLVDISAWVGKDIAIYRKAVNGGTNADDLLFICKKVPASALSNNGTKLTLKINHYKLN